MPKKSPYPKRVLVVEDERPMAHALELKLKGCGFNPILAANGEQGLALASQGSFDLILLDLIMPKMNGFDVLQNLRERKNKTPVIVLTNLGQEEDEQRVKTMGATHYFVKSDVPLVAIIKYIKENFS